MGMLNHLLVTSSARVACLAFDIRKLPKNGFSCPQMFLVVDRENALPLFFDACLISTVSFHYLLFGQMFLICWSVILSYCQVGWFMFRPQNYKFDVLIISFLTDHDIDSVICFSQFAWFYRAELCTSSVVALSESIDLQGSKRTC